jgi:hypothetical protein
VERLTKRISPEIIEFVDGKGYAQMNHQEGVKALFDCLAAYEDTNLTPSDIADLRNELCLKCGRYKTAHEGACRDCIWRKEK